MSDDNLLTRLLPTLTQPQATRFNVFDVMHHGTHEKQLSNVFAFLLDQFGTHGLGNLFTRIFIDEINRRILLGSALPYDDYQIAQEVNVHFDRPGADIADIVLESDLTVIVVENYVTSDGHGHSYDQYRKFVERDGKVGSVVLLSRDYDPGLQKDGWEKAPVLTYGVLIDRLFSEIRDNRKWATGHPEVSSFIAQMRDKYGKEERKVEERQVIEFLSAMGDSGEMARYRTNTMDKAAQKFAADVAAQAETQFLESRKLLMRLKHQVKVFCDGVLRGQLNRTYGPDFVRGVISKFKGIYEYCTVISIGEAEDEARVQILFGPSAWVAHGQRDPYYNIDSKLENADYSRLFIASADKIVQSAVTLEEVLAGLPADDERLLCEIIEFIGRPSAQ